MASLPLYRVRTSVVQADPVAHAGRAVPVGRVEDADPAARVELAVADSGLRQSRSRLSKLDWFAGGLIREQNRTLRTSRARLRENVCAIRTRLDCGSRHFVPRGVRETACSQSLVEPFHVEVDARRVLLG